MQYDISRSDALFFPGVSADSGKSPLETAMLGASVDCIKIISVDGTLLTMNRAGCLALGVAENSRFGTPWLPLLPASVRAAGEAAIAQARTGRPARFPGRSELGGQTRHWDNLLTPVVDGGGQVQLIVCVSRDVTDKALLEHELEEALKREVLLAEEMRHRVKNVFAVIMGLIALTERELAATDPPAKAVRILREKFAAFARASDLALEPAGDEGVDADRLDLGLTVQAVLQPYAGKWRAEGQRCAIPRSAMTATVLFLHELATNSIKYGALGTAN